VDGRNIDRTEKKVLDSKKMSKNLSQTA
jgi:hypothetical protein